MTDVTVDMDNLDTFSDVLFQKIPEPTKFGDDEDGFDNKEVDENEENPLATEEDEDEPQDDPEDKPSEDDDEPEEKPEEKKKSKFQTRIDELVTEARVAQRERDALRQELEAIRARSEVKKEEPTLREQLPDGAPSPDALDSKGEPLYPLGEFDPRFIADITRFSIKQEMKAAEEARQKAEQEARLRSEQDEIKSKWNEKVNTYAEDHPEFKENVRAIDVAFANIEPRYGEYLATVIMGCDNGPAIMDYLSQNIGEAQKIVASGAHAATLAIGRLDARFEKPVEETQSNKQRVSDAPPPPETRVRGQGGRFVARDDTDDLSAFEEKFFKR